MKNPNSNFLDQIQPKIHFIRGHRVMLDSDLAELYGVETGALNRAVRRNLERFPADFMFQLQDVEEENLRCQVGISSLHGGKRYASIAFTEQGIAMLSSVLRSDTAIKGIIIHTSTHRSDAEEKLCEPDKFRTPRR